MSADLRHQTFCVLPWLHSFVNYNGGYQVCCTSEEYLLSLADENGAPLTIQNAPTLDQVMNSAQMKKLRQDMLIGVRSPICTRCFQTEDMGGVSRRQMENMKYQDLISGLINKTAVDGSIEFTFKSIDYRLGNSCNLKCRMCSPQSSSGWIDEWNRVKPENEHLSVEKLTEYKNYRWMSNELLTHEFRGKIKDIDRLHFAGGEPLIVPELARLLQICIDEGVAPNISLSFNTNLSVLPSRVLELWKSFKEVKLLCSIDGHGKLNEYIRHPSKWESIDKNLRFLDEKAETFHVSEIMLSSTVQIFNVLGLGELYQYLSTFKKIVPALNLINLHEPVYFETRLLPKKIKNVATERLMKVRSELEGVLPPHYQYLRENIVEAINFMNSEDLSHLLPLFRKTNARIDRERGLTMHHYAPELNTLLARHYLADL